MKFVCVTPTFNAERYIRHTMCSVLNQTFLQEELAELEYLIQDGGSTDKTREIARSIASDFGGRNNISVSVYSDADAGMYDAISKGFNRVAKGDWYCYLNAGDYYAPCAFEIIAKIVRERSDVQFLSGASVIYNEDNHLVSYKVPFKYTKELFMSGSYGTVLPHIQQESTFWSFRMHSLINFSKLEKFRYAGDAYLWSVFLGSARLHIVAAWLGGFKRHSTQLSAVYGDQYKLEMELVCSKKSFFKLLKSYVFKLMWLLPLVVKKRFNSDILVYDHSRKKYR
jgi:glycosyltransferase involved in cell wall biosynthesis